MFIEEGDSNCVRIKNLQMDDIVISTSDEHEDKLRDNNVSRKKFENQSVSSGLALIHEESHFCSNENKSIPSGLALIHEDPHVNTSADPSIIQDISYYLHPPFILVPIHSVIQ